MACAQQLDAGHDVAFIDFEDRPGRVTSRLLALGATPQRIKDGFRYIRPWEPLGAPQGAALDAAAHGCTLAVIDGVTEAMSAHGLNPDDNNDVAAFYALIPKRITRQGPAVILIDHVVKDPERQGRWGIGGQHKLAGIDGVSYMVKCVEPFGRGKTGKARISIGKDRPGHVEEHAAGRAIATFVLESNSGGNELRATLEMPESAPVNQYGDFRPTVLMERVSKWLEAHPGSTKTDIQENVRGNQNALSQAITALVDEGYLEVEDGPRRARLHRVTTPFTQSAEED